MAINKLPTAAIQINAITAEQIAPGAITVNDIPDNEISMAKLSQVNLAIAPEVLGIQVDSPTTGQDVPWIWTWQQSTLPYARRTITNSPEIQVPLYKQGTYVIDNFAAYDIHGTMTQTHSIQLKWIDGAGSDNLVSWSVSSGPVTTTHASINSGSSTQVQRLTVNVPTTVVVPTLNLPTGVTYTITNSGAGAYAFANAANGSNPNIGPLYRGATYTFNVTASGHPFYLTTDNGTNFVAGTFYGEYTAGVTNSRTQTGSLSFTVPANAPDTLYYQCGNHSAMRGAITIKELAVETNNNGNLVIYAQHSQEGMKTPVEIRPIPSLVNQMCLVYDASSGMFVPQDLATYVENTPSFKNKIQEVAGTATLVAADGTAVVASVNVYSDSTYLPILNNNAGDLAFATDNNSLYIWDGSAWQVTKARTTDELAEGSVKLYYTDARARTAISATGSLNYNNATGVMSFSMPAQTTTAITEGTNLYYTDERVDDRVSALIVGGSNITATYNDAAGTLTIDGQPGYANSDVATYLSSNGYATATSIIADITASAPATLDTLNELAAALGDDPNFATTTATAIGEKVAKAGDTMTGDLSFGDNVSLNLGDSDDASLVFDGTDTKLTSQGELILNGQTGITIDCNNVTNQPTLFLNDIGAGNTGILLRRASGGTIMYGQSMDHSRPKAIASSNKSLGFYVAGSGGNASYAAFDFNVDANASNQHPAVMGVRSPNNNALLFQGEQSDSTVVFSVDYDGNVATSGTVDGVDIAARDAVLTSTTTTANAALPKTGGTMTGDLSFGDNVQAVFGAGSDLFIKSDGSNSIIQGAGAGTTYLRGSSLVIGSNGGAGGFPSTIYVSGNSSTSHVEMNYGASKKFETTSTGINVTGTVDANGNVKTNGFFINSATISTNTTLQNGDNAMTTGPVTIASSVTITLDPGSRWVVL
jgi:hypothetical protein